ncbi:MAG: hypothetical protein ACE37E_00410 [Hyphomicrobiales bacterium]
MLARTLDWAVFAPDINNPDHQLFTASLASIRAHLQTVGQPVSQAEQRPFEINVTFLESGLPNALANKIDGKHVAAVNTGLAVTIHEFGLFCFAQSSFLPMIGEPSKEASPSLADGTPPGVALLLATAKADQGEPVLDRFVMPQCPHRTVAAHYLTLIMLRFVWLHEVAHGLLGHVDYLRDKQTSAEISELHVDELAQGIPGIDGRVLQCMEFEADSWAIGKLIAIQAHGGENIDGIASLHMALRLQMNVFAAYSLCWLMETLASTARRGRLNITHPAPVRRLQNLQNIAANELKFLNFESTRMLRDVSAQFEGVLSQIGKQWVQMDKFEPVSYRAVFDQMRQDLAPYRYLIPDED